MRARTIAVVLATALTAPVVHAADAAPRAPRRPVVDTYFGVPVTDPYRWLEDGKDPEVKAWTEAQTLAARAQLDALPGHPAIKAQVADIVRSASEAYLGLVDRPGQLFALKVDPAKQQPLLVRLPAGAEPSKARVVLDPNLLDPTGKTTIDFFVPSRDGQKLLVSMSVGGTESGDLHVLDVASGKALGPVIPRIYGGTAGGSAAWNADGSSSSAGRSPCRG